MTGDSPEKASPSAQGTLRFDHSPTAVRRFLPFFGYLFPVLGGYILNLWLWCQSIDRNKIASKGNKQPAERERERERKREKSH